MINAVLHVCDETRGAHLCERVSPLDTARTPFNVLVRHLSEISQSGVWLKPFRGLIPRMPGFPPVEILLLSEKLEVVDFIKGHPENGFSDVDSRVASALVVPALSVEHSGVQVGDRIKICDSLTRVEWDGLNDEPRARGRHCMCFTGETDDRNGATRTDQLRAAIAQAKAAEKQDSLPEPPVKKKTLRERFFTWLTGYEEDSERRHARRNRFSNLVAYYWTGGTPKAFNVGDIGPTGFYLLTTDRWTLGTRIIMTFQHTDRGPDSPDSSIMMPATVIRTGEDGVGFAFVASAAVDPRTAEVIPADDETRSRLNRFLEVATR